MKIVLKLIFIRAALYDIYGVNSSIRFCTVTTKLSVRIKTLIVWTLAHLDTGLQPAKSIDRRILLIQSFHHKGTVVNRDLQALIMQLKKVQ